MRWNNVGYKKEIEQFEKMSRAFNLGCLHWNFRGTALSSKKIGQKKKLFKDMQKNFLYCTLEMRLYSYSVDSV